MQHWKGESLPLMARESITLPGNRISEVRALTGIRGVAAMHVVFYHYFVPTPLTTPFLCLLGHGYLAVDLFFSLSGFVMALNYGELFSQGVRLTTWWLFLSRRIARLYPLYLLTLLIGTILVATGHLEYRGGPLIRSFVPNLLMVQNWGSWVSIDGAAWSISAEFFAYLLFPFILSRILFRGWGSALTSGLVCVVGICGLALFHIHHHDALKMLDETGGPLSVVRCMLEFCLGILMYRSTDSSFGQAVKRQDWICYALTAAILASMAFPRTDLLVALLLPLHILSLNGSTNYVSRLLGWRPVEYLGLWSFSIYLLHWLLNPVLASVDTSLRRHGIPHSHTLAVGLTLPLLFACSMATYYAIEVPGRRLLRQLLESSYRRPTLAT